MESNVESKIIVHAFGHIVIEMAGVNDASEVNREKLVMYPKLASITLNAN